MRKEEGLTSFAWRCLFSLAGSRLIELFDFFFTTKRLVCNRWTFWNRRLMNSIMSILLRSSITVANYAVYSNTLYNVSSGMVSGELITPWLLENALIARWEEDNKCDE